MVMHKIMSNKKFCYTISASRLPLKETYDFLKQEQSWMQPVFFNGADLELVAREFTGKLKHLVEYVGSHQFASIMCCINGMYNISSLFISQWLTVLRSSKNHCP